MMRGIIQFLFAVLMAVGSAHAGDWPQWRGPNHDGSSAETGLPASWSLASGVLWSADLPGMSSATPVIAGEKVFVVSSNDDHSEIFGLCFDRDSGKELWRKKLVENAGKNSRNDMASCSPVADGERVFFLFGNTDLHAFDHGGNQLWYKDVTKEAGSVEPMWGYSSSPFLYQEKLYILALSGAGTKGSYLLCLDPATGKQVYKAPRRSDAVGESLDAYTTPVIYEADGTRTIVIAGADAITGHKAATGEEVWRHSNNPSKIRNWRLIPSATVIGDLVCGVEPRGGSAFAFRPSPGADLKWEETVWKYDERTTDVPTPLFYDGRLYLLNGTRRIMMCLDPQTGKEHWRGEIENAARIWASPTAGDGKIYCMDEDGQVIVLAAGESFKELSRAKMGGDGESKSSVALANGKLFIRTTERLYCIGK